MVVHIKLWSEDGDVDSKRENCRSCVLSNRKASGHSTLPVPCFVAAEQARSVVVRMARCVDPVSDPSYHFVVGAGRPGVSHRGDPVASQPHGQT